jgi:predicted kinase
LFLTVGLPGTGKTTDARRIEVEKKALRLTKDEWLKALYGLANPSSASDVIEGRLIEIGLRALELGINVVIDYGLWGRDERGSRPRCGGRDALFRTHAGRAAQKT